MTNTPLPQGQYTQDIDNELARKLGDQMVRHSFDGNIPAFHATFAQYLSDQSGADPFGRALLNGQVMRDGLLSFRSTSTDAQELREQSALRWAAWVSVLPLDMQLHLITKEASPRFELPVDPAALKWSQWWDILESPDPAAAYASSALFSGGSPEQAQSLLDAGDESASWRVMQAGLVCSTQCRAMQLMAWKSWESLAAWMGDARMHACEEVTLAYIHYSKKHSWGSVSSSTNKPLPFWTMGVFAGASEPEFWAVMRDFGGPGSASEVFQKVANPVPRPASIQSFATGRNHVAPPVSDRWGDPMCWLPSNVILTPAALDSIDHTYASWKMDAMEAGVSLPSEKKKPAARF